MLLSLFPGLNAVVVLAATVVKVAVVVAFLIVPVCCHWCRTQIA